MSARCLPGACLPACLPVAACGFRCVLGPELVREMSKLSKLSKSSKWSKWSKLSKLSKIPTMSKMSGARCVAREMRGGSCVVIVRCQDV